MFRTANNTRLAIVFVIILVLMGATAGRAMHLHHQHSVHTRALAVDSLCLMCALAPLAASVFALSIPPTLMFAGSEQRTSSHYDSGAFSQPITRPPPSLA
jgi:hypothetical protein